MIMTLMKVKCLFAWITLASVASADDEVVAQITILANETVALPCAISTQPIDDVAVIILWYKGASPAPFYSYDLRQTEGRHWSDETVLGQRAFFDPTLNPPSLKVTPVRPLDQDTYRCRVDYERGPSKTSTVLLVVIVPPSRPVITDESGALVRDTAGPYLEGGRVVLTCKTIGGRPSPTLVWLRDGLVVGDSYTVDHRGQVRNLLHLDNLSRKMLDTSYTCRANNNNITQALDATIAINLTLAPLTITLKKVTIPEEYVSAGTIEELECSSYGSRPEPVISWWKDDRRISNPRAKEMQMLNKTMSVLRIVPRPEDHGVVYTCRVENPKLPSSVLEDFYKLNVHYVPDVELVVGMGLSPKSVREGSDIFFECRVKANPKLYKITWVHEGTVMEHNITGGVIMSNQTLVLQRVGRGRAGRYFCRATNLHGEGVSNPIPITVMFTPVCSSGQKLEYQVAHHDTANITCRVDAVPDNVTFTWRFNSSGSLLELAERRAASWGTTSVLPYTPASPGDYGLLLCSATNAQGTQHLPCIFNVTASKPPDLLADCIIKNQTTDTVFVSCKGIPTVLPRTFSMEVRNSEDLHLVTKVTNTTPHFIATGLDPGTAYTLHVGVLSPMGASTPIKLQAFTVKTAEKRMGMIQPTEEVLGMYPLVAVVVGAAITIVIILVIILALAIKHCPRERQGQPPGAQFAASSSLVSDASPKETISTFSRPSPASEDRNPDIIPQKEECDYQLEELRVPSCQVVSGVTPCHQLTSVAPTMQVPVATGPVSGPAVMTSAMNPYQQQQQWEAYYHQQHLLQFHHQQQQQHQQHQHHHQHHHHQQQHQQPQQQQQQQQLPLPTSTSQTTFRTSHDNCQLVSGLPEPIMVGGNSHGAYPVSTTAAAAAAVYGSSSAYNTTQPPPSFINMRTVDRPSSSSPSPSSIDPLVSSSSSSNIVVPEPPPDFQGTDQCRHESSV